MISSQAASQMTSSQTQLTFRKTAACPASSTLLSYRAAKVSRKVAMQVRAVDALDDLATFRGGTRVTGEDDVALARQTAAVGRAVDDHVVTGLQGGRHAEAGDIVAPEPTAGRDSPGGRGARGAGMRRDDPPPLDTIDERED